MSRPDELVDALADLLAQEEPEAADDDAARALAAAALALAAAPGLDLVDSAAELLAATTPDAVAEADARSLARRALAAAPSGSTSAGAGGSADVVRLEPFRQLPLLAAAAIMAVVVTGAFLGAPSTAPPTVHRFEGGHRVVAEGGALWDWEATPAGLRVRVRGGEVMFDVDPNADHSVRVFAGGVTVRVTGTVFTVRQSRDVTRVAVFEGAVALTGEGLLSFLEAGDRWEGDPRRGIFTGDAVFEPGLSAEAVWAAERRGDSAESYPVIVPVLPEVPDLAADGRLPQARPDEEPPSRDSDDPRDSPGGAQGAEGAASSAPGRGSPAAEPRDPEPTLPDARAALTNRQYPAARALADRALRGSVSADWLLVRADALRGEGRLEEAAAEYTRAALVGDSRDRAVAGLSAARILGRDLGRREMAQQILRSSGALDAASPVQAQAQALVEELNGEP